LTAAAAISLQSVCAMGAGWIATASSGAQPAIMTNATQSKNALMAPALVERRRDDRTMGQ
jgi:hypothetical protein